MNSIALGPDIWLVFSSECKMLVNYMPRINKAVGAKNLAFREAEALNTLF